MAPLARTVNAAAHPRWQARNTGPDRSASLVERPALDERQCCPDTGAAEAPRPDQTSQLSPRRSPRRCARHPEQRRDRAAVIRASPNSYAWVNQDFSLLQRPTGVTPRQPPPRTYHTASRRQSYSKAVASHVDGFAWIAAWSSYATPAGCHTAPPRKIVRGCQAVKRHHNLRQAPHESTGLSS